MRKWEIAKKVVRRVGSSEESVCPTFPHARTGSVDDIRHLSSDIRPALLRGVRADVALRQCGEIFKTGGIGNFGDAYEISQDVELLDKFVSHDWNTGRVLKYLTLCVALNLKAALIASLLFGMLLTYVPLDFVLKLFPAVYYREKIAGSSGNVALSVRCQLGCPVAFIIVFLFWQHIKQLVGLRVSWLFVDKVCINQSKADLKAEAILGLAGFLKYSRRLLILWSPRYFTRLWCTYEIASWVHLGKDFDTSIQFVPVPLTGFLIYTTIVFWIVLQFDTFATITVSNSQGGSFIAYMALDVPAIILVGAGTVVNFAFGILRDLHVIRSQLAQFSVRNSQCFCCQHQHIHPDTKEVLPCDRKLVYMTLKRWFSSLHRCEEGVQEDPTRFEPEVEGAHLDAFDNIVRTAVTERLGHSGTCMNYTRALMPGLPFAWRLMDRLPNISFHVGEPVPLQVKFRVCCSFIVWFVACIPCSLWLTFHIGGRLAASRTDPNRVQQAMLTAKGVVALCLLVVPCGVLFEYSYRLEEWQLQFVISFAFLVCTAILYNKNLADFCQSRLSVARHHTFSHAMLAAGSVGTEMTAC